MEPGIRLPTPYIVSNQIVHGSISFTGDFIGWDKEVKIY